MKIPEKSTSDEGDITHFTLPWEEEEEEEKEEEKACGTQNKGNKAPKCYLTYLAKFLCEISSECT